MQRKTIGEKCNKGGNENRMMDMRVKTERNNWRKKMGSGRKDVK